MIRCVDVKLKTHDNYIQQIDLNCIDNNTLITSGAIGDKKELEFHLFYDPDVSASDSLSDLLCGSDSGNTLPDSFELFFNNNLFGIAFNWEDIYTALSIDSPPPQGWYIKYDADIMVNNTAYDMEVYGASINANSQKNFQATFTPLGCNEFRVNFTFFLTMDMDDIINSAEIVNHDRLLKDHQDNPTELNNDAQCVYDTDKEVNTLFYFKTDDDQGFVTHEFPVTFRFYDKDLYNADTICDIDFSLSRGGVDQTKFNKFAQTLVTVDFDSDIDIDYMSAWLINIDEVDNIKDFFSNYDASFANIETNAAVVQLDNKIYAPSTFNDGTAAQGTFFVDNDLDCNATYRLIALGYNFETMSWVSQTSGVATTLNDIHFINANTGWTCGIGGVILKTTDAGENWNAQTSNTPEILFSIYFTDSNNGWTCGANGEIVRTTDGGATPWAVQVSGTAVILNSIYFIDSNTGWVCGDSGVIRISVNGGVAWAAQTSNTANQLNSIQFVDANNGWACGAGGTLQKTTDGGATPWSTETTNVIVNLNDLSFLNTLIGYCCGSGGVVIKTEDGGSTWNSVNIPVSITLFGIEFIDTETGWVVGTGGNVYKTSDGGASWVLESTDISTTTTGISMIDNKTGYVSGQSGVILEYVGDGLGAVYSNISDEIEVDCNPDCCGGIYQRHSWADYNNADWLDDSIIATVQDRVKGFGEIGIDDIYTCVQSWANDLGIDASPAGYANPNAYRITEVTAQIREVRPDYPSNTQNTYAIYDEVIAKRDQDTGVWTVPDDMTITETSTRLSYSRTFRSRYEDYIEPIDVRIANQTDEFAEESVGSLLSNYANTLGFNQDWVGRDLELVWKVKVDFPDAAVPFDHYYIYRERFYVRGYDNDDVTPVITDIQFYDPDTMTELTQICSGDNDWIFVRVVLDCDASESISCSESCCCDNKNLIAQIDTALFGTDNLNEEESYAGQLTQLSTDELYDVEEFFGNDCEGFFKLDLTELTEGQLYRISGMSKAICHIPDGLDPAIIVTITGGSWGVLPEGIYEVFPDTYSDPAGSYGEVWVYQQSPTNLYYIRMQGHTTTVYNDISILKPFINIRDNTIYNYNLTYSGSFNVTQVKIVDGLFQSYTINGVTITIQRSCNNPSYTLP